MNECTIEQAVATFPDMLRDAGRQRSPDLDKLLAAMRKVDGLALSEIGHGGVSERQEQKSKALSGLVLSYIRDRISRRFALLDESLFARRRFVQIEFIGDDASIAQDTTVEPKSMAMANGARTLRWVKGPLFLCYAVSQGRWGRRGNAEQVEFSRVTWPGQRRSEAVVSAKFPGRIGNAQLRYADQCRAEIARAVADLLEIPETADVVRHLDCSPELEAYWIPGRNFLAISKVALPDKRDPALVVEAFGARFLCCIWDVEEEEPIDSILREFSDGAVNVAAQED